MDGKGLGTGAGVDLFGDPVRVACPSCDGRGAHPVSGQTRYHQDGGVYRPTGSTPCPRCQRGPPRNSAGSSDRDLVVSVLRTALGDGYAVIGHPMRVYRCAGRAGRSRRFRAMSRTWCPNYSTRRRCGSVGGTSTRAAAQRAEAGR